MPPSWDFTSTTQKSLPAAGKKSLIQFFVGDVMRKTKGKANPQVVKRMLNSELNK